MPRMADNMAVRTKFFDDFFLDATEAGIRQAVILASGLDARAYRLPWPAGTVVYEIDQPQVIEFKTARWPSWAPSPPPSAARSPSICATTGPPALRAAGFDPASPTAWSAEGLLGYLPPEAQDRLLDTITDAQRAGQPAGHRKRAQPRARRRGEGEGAHADDSERWRCARVRPRHRPGWSTSATATRRRRTWPTTAGG